MVATVQIQRKTGIAPGTGTDITNINTRAVTKDAHYTADMTYPIRRPEAGLKYSYWITERLNCTVTPGGTINNIRVYTDGVNNLGPGITVKGAKASTGLNAGYRQAGLSGEDIEGDTGQVLNQTNHTGLDAVPADIFGWTEAAPLSLNGSISNPNTGEFGDHFVYQVEVGPTANPGATPAQETIYWKYDET
jgi:hypothetical protein